MDQEGMCRMVSSSAVMVDSLGKSTRIRMAQILEKREEADYNNRRTRIVCTMGPSCSSVDTLVEMIDAGMNVCRLNFSHGDHQSHGKVVENIEIAQKKRPNNRVAIMLDTKGPEIRTGLLKDKTIDLKQDSELKIVTDYEFVGDNTCIACSYKKLPQSVKPGNVILMADGSVSCRVLECGDDYVKTKVLNNARIGEKKNMNLPNVKVDLPCIGEKDKDDILNFGIPHGCNFIAASFVQTANDVRQIRDLLGPRGRHIKIIPKIENVEGLKNFDEILEVSDGIMVARGDMGMEIAPEKVFLAQKMMIAKCNVAGKPVITATQMLESMTKNPRPTRAEAADVANAVLDGTDCVMLSGETAGGDFPVAAVQVMARVCLEAETCIDYPNLYRALCLAIQSPLSVQESIARAAVEAAECAGAKLIICLTETGHTARLIAKYRPLQLILALSAAESTIRHLSIHRGVFTLPVASLQGTDNVIKSALETAKSRDMIKSGDTVVAVHGIKEEVAGSSNLLKVLDVE